MDMGIRHQRNSDGVRTIWTAEMDRYFIDLMLEQVGKGNRIDDHLFSKRAWKHMTLLFNAKFKFQYEKDVLKNRHKTLRNVYKAINKLLTLNGFSWDHTQQMVTAHSKVWDDYIKVHPGARSYRIKTIPYYHDLCRIYKNTPTEGASAADALKVNDKEVLHDIMIDEDFGVDDVELSRARRTYWQPPMDRYLIDLMVDQVQKGNQIDGLFNKQAWIAMTGSFNSSFGFKYDVDILKNRYKTFKRQYNTIKKLLESQGFFWDPLRQMVIADDPTWQDYIEANTDARQYMTRPVPYYKDLCIVFLCEEETLTLSAASTDDLIQHGSSHKARIMEESMASALREMATAVSGLADDKKKKKKKKKKDEDSSIAVEHVIEAIQCLPDMDDDLILDACDFLEDDKKAKTFLSLDVKLRRKWLIRKLRSQPEDIS